LRRFAKNENSARRHWPWAAMAIGLYKSETDNWAKYADEPSPKQIRELLAQIERGARDLRSGFTNLQEFSNRLPDPSSPKLAAKRFDAGLLERERSQSNRALPSFVFRCGTTWKSMTGRKPSANRVARKRRANRAPNANPDFVIFVRA